MIRLPLNESRARKIAKRANDAGPDNPLYRALAVLTDARLSRTTALTQALSRLRRPRIVLDTVADADDDEEEVVEHSLGSLSPLATVH